MNQETLTSNFSTVKSGGCMDKPWLQSYPEGVPHEINLNEYESVVDVFEKSVKQFAKYPVFSNFGTSLSYAQLDTLSSHFASYLQHVCKKQKGDRIAIMLPNVLQYPVVMFGALRAGLTVVNVNPLYTAHELKIQLQDADVDTVVVLSNFAHVVEEVVADVHLKHVVVTDIGDLLGGLKGHLITLATKYIKRMVPAWSVDNTIRFKEAMSRGARHKLQKVALTGEDIAFLQYTGGTTGVPKGAELTHRNMVANILQCTAWMKSIQPTPGKDVILGALPLYHIFSLTVCCLTFISQGCECLLITNPRDLKMFIATLLKKPVTVFVGLNTLFHALLNRKAFEQVDFSKLKLSVAGGMATQTFVAKKWEQRTGAVLLEGYGLTEASPVVCINPINIKQHNHSIGLPLPSTNAAIRDEHGNDLAIGEVGELWVKGPQVMKGYWNKPEETAIVLDKNGWLSTGDMVTMDEKGFINIVDRKKDMILVSGFNVYPSEVEHAIAEHDAVEEVAVIGVPNEKTGEAVKAFVVANNSDISKNDIIAHCRKTLTHYKVPKIIEFRDDLPKSNVGKVLRRALRE